MENLPVAWIFHSCWVRFICDRDLARTTTVDGSVCSLAKIEGDALRFASDQIGNGTTLKFGSLTREIATISDQGRLRFGVCERRWLLDSEMSANLDGKAETECNSFGSHVDFVGNSVLELGIGIWKVGSA
jgi:hypothetical protein